MLETAIGLFGVPLAAAARLTLVEYRLLEGGYRRRLKAEHERDTWRAWMAGEFNRHSFKFDEMVKIATGKGRKTRDPNDPDGGLALQRALAVQQGFEEWYATTQGAVAVPADVEGEDHG